MKDSQDTFSIEKKHSFSPVVILFLSLIVMALLAGIGYILLQTDVLTQNPSSEDDVSKDREKEVAIAQSLYDSEGTPISTQGVQTYGLTGEAIGDFGGFLILSANLAKDADATRLFLINLEAENKLAQEYLPLLPISGFAEFENTQNPKNLFLSTVSEASVQDFPNTSQRIHQINFEDGLIRYLDSGEGYFLRRIEWAPQTQLLAFVRAKSDIKSYPGLIPVTEWETVVVRVDIDADPSAETVIDVIDGATQPKWSPDGTTMLYLKEDGLFAYDVNAGTHGKVKGVVDGKRVLTTSMIDVSPDGKYLIWTTPKSGVITMYEISSWEDLDLQELGRIVEADTEFYWPQFSPDGNYYVVQAIEAPKGDSFSRGNPRLEFRPTLGRTVVMSYPLLDFEFDGLFTDDWVENLPSIAQ